MGKRGEPMTADAHLRSIAPFFIVSNLTRSLAFYKEVLGFSVRVAVPEPEPFFALIYRDDVELSLKEIGPEVPPQPNHRRHEWAKWDASVFTGDPDALAEEFSQKTGLRTELANTDDGLRGFEVEDPDGYVLFFGRPLTAADG